jgi:hypothetical protein
MKPVGPSPIGGNMEPSERFMRVLKVHNTLDLFPLLCDWPTEELLALDKDVETYVEFAYAAVDKGWGKMAFEPPIFLNAAASMVLDQTRDSIKMQITEVAAEILSVAYFYLHQRGVEIPGGDDGA